MLYKETVEPSTLGLLIELMNLPELQQFRLVGGTALSLLLGHRKSIDIDLFTDQPFDRNLILNKLSNRFQDFIFADEKSPRLLFTTINNIKVDVIHTFEKFYAPEVIIEQIRFAATEEIIALKLNAIAGRGAKKDFWDLNALLKQYSLEEMLKFYQNRYPQNSLMMVLKSIPYFIEADLDMDPYSFDNLNWTTIKKNIIKAFNNYLKNK